MKRVVITGAGTINALGKSVSQTMEAMREGRCGIGDLEFRPTILKLVAVPGHGEQAHTLEF